MNDRVLIGSLILALFGVLVMNLSLYAMVKDLEGRIDKMEVLLCDGNCA